MTSGNKLIAALLVLVCVLLILNLMAGRNVPPLLAQAGGGKADNFIMIPSISKQGDAGVYILNAKTQKLGFYRVEAGLNNTQKIKLESIRSVEWDLDKIVSFNGSTDKEQEVKEIKKLNDAWEKGLRGE